MTPTPTRSVPAPALVYSTDLLPEPGDLPTLDLGALLRGGSVHVEDTPARPREYRGETPIHGQGAVARWLALHDRARQMRVALRPGDGVGIRQAQRAIRSLFLTSSYEHQLLPVTRRQARSALWRRERVEPLPAFAERARWARCRCPQCQPALHERSVVVPSSLADVFPRSA